MKYFRKHPDLLIIANYPEGVHRVRHARTTTPAQIAKILVHTLAGQLGKTKKILLLTDATDEKPRRGWITRTAWAVGKPQSFTRLISRLIYNHETHAACVLFHPDLFGRFWTDASILFLITSLRITGKHTMIVFLTTPKLSVQPTIVQTIRYFIRYGILVLLATLTTHAVVGEKSFAGKLRHSTGKRTILTIPMTFRSLKERKIAGKILGDELFPSPTHNLGLANMLKKESI